ncbi:MAG TPA: RNA polymerase sigma factor [Vicinamibacteria bacterium]|nr:RNA polymerase sigma factor [Vicinamibacteria bacterium]
MPLGEGDGDFGRAALGHLDRLYAFACALARDRQAAEDLVQETYLRALRAARRPGPDENLQGWLFTILHNVWRNEARRKRPESLDSHPEWMGGLAALDPSPPDALEGERTAERVATFIDAMPRHLREVIVLRFGEGFSYQQIANIVGCPAGTVMSRLSRGRAMVRRAFGPWNGAGNGNAGSAGS